MEGRNAVGNLVIGHTLLLKPKFRAITHARDDGKGFGEVHGVDLSACGWLMRLVITLIAELSRKSESGMTYRISLALGIRERQ